MESGFLELIQSSMKNPLLAAVLLLVCGVLFVNGWTDAPNAITACVSTGVLKMKQAVILASICNFAGMLLMSLWVPGVAFSIYRMADFGTNPKLALLALCAALGAIIIWAVSAWCFGIPTSESHALIAAISGAALAMEGGAIRGEEWMKILWGLVLSMLLGYVLGWLFYLILEVFYHCEYSGKRKSGSCQILKSERQPDRSIMEKGQIWGAGAMAFMHGAQDGQKFMGVLLLGITLSGYQVSAEGAPLPLWMIIACSILMAAGTAVGGKRIIQKVGSEMVSLNKNQGFAADLAGAVCLLLATVSGLPVSTTHVKTTAMIGAASISEETKANKKVVKQMVTAWLLTFPVCAVLGFFMVKLFFFLFGVT